MYIYCQHHDWLKEEESAHTTKECKVYSCAVRNGKAFTSSNFAALEFMSTAVYRANNKTNVKAKFSRMSVKMPGWRTKNKVAVPSDEEEVIENIPSEKVNIAKIDSAKAKLGFGSHKTMAYNGYVMSTWYSLLPVAQILWNHHRSQCDLNLP